MKCFKSIIAALLLAAKFRAPATARKLADHESRSRIFTFTSGPGAVPGRNAADVVISHGPHGELEPVGQADLCR